MGGIDKTRFRQFKALLALADEALELADRYGIDEYRLCAVLRLATEIQAEMVQHIIKFNLTGRQVAEICDKGLPDDINALETDLPPQVRRLVKSLKKIDESDEGEFIRGLLSEEKTVSMARARLDFTIEFLQRAKTD